MFLSRLILSPRSREARRDLGDCQEMHRTLLRAFPQAEGAAVGNGGAREHFGVLYRVEFDRRLNAFAMLVQSRVEPDWSRLPEGYVMAAGAGAVTGAACKPVAKAFGAIDVGARLRFRLRANPTRRISERNRDEKSGGQGKRVELRGEEQQLEWLRRKGEAHGFRLASVCVAKEISEAKRKGGDVLNVRVAPEAKAHGGRRGESVGDGRSYRRRLTFGSVLFEGELIVTDAGTFRESLQEGIGSGKAFGFGLLSVAPAVI